MSTIKSARTTIVLFRMNDIDAFIAAFIYWRLFGRESTRPSDTILNGNVPTIQFKAVDVFDDATKYIGWGNIILSVGLNLSHSNAFDGFFSYENDTTFEPLDKTEGVMYYYDQKAKLSELMLKSLEEAKHISSTDKSFEKLNQFFQFYDGTGSGFQINDAVAERIMMYFPRLRVEDFRALNDMIEDPIAFMENQQRITPEMAVKNYVHLQALKAQEETHEPLAYEAQTGIQLKMINTDLVSSPMANQLFDGSSVHATMIYCFVNKGVRVKYYSSDKGENALAVFPQDRQKYGNEKRADWLISEQDFCSLILNGSPM